MNNDDYLNSLIQASQELTRQLAEVQERIRAHENPLEGEFVQPLCTPEIKSADGKWQQTQTWWDRDGKKIPA